ncbi:hypothetical protein EUTSA_v10019122mg [Eutrema salsugineum]|uniref:FLZ-type domain-containing protein n=1 Tax=Eutrema salsugineum TaxID=72664 RepID=V4K9E5_EUTSA|nr:uncharacterized protein LOC18008898 [Eutrema salsugineum]ESQ27654.1 hypothetical protein EUTSA_v10019122mg [Eutrema salsugineum]
MILSKRPHLMIRKLSEMLVPGSRSAIKTEDYTASPRSPLDLKFPSPVNSKRYSSGGIGLGIVAALEESCIGINRYDPVRHSGRFRCPEIDLSEEEYTYVTSRDGPTKVYYNEDGFELFESVSRPMVLVDEPPVLKRQSLGGWQEFLSSCCLCKKRLQGKDIYMYKGEMGFCSAECRSVQIMKDDQNEQRKSQVSRSVDVSSSPYAGEQSFSAGIFVF